MEKKEDPPIESIPTIGGGDGALSRRRMIGGDVTKDPSSIPEMGSG
jgi:hypothetical protein